MWFLFGIITLTSFSIFSCYKRINAAWIGDLSYRHGIKFQYKVSRNKNELSGILVGIDAPKNHDYSLKHENFVDRFFKSVGLSNEHQIGNREFDDLVYVVSDNSELLWQISSRPKIADSVVRLFKAGKDLNLVVKEVRHNSGRLWVKLKTNSGFDERTIVEKSAVLARILKEIADEIEQIPQASVSGWKDPFVLKAAIILAVSTGLAVNGCVHLVRLFYTKMPFTVDTDRLLADAVFLGVGIVFVLIFSTLIVLGRSARTHLVLIELLLIGTFGAVSTAFSELRDMNIELDKSIAVAYEVNVVDKKISKTRKSRNYYVYLNDWNESGDQKKTRVSRVLYDKAMVGDIFIVKQKAGYLNYRWVESLEAKNDD